jgi:hypothetical protein
MAKYPKGFNKWTLDQQEAWLVKEHIELVNKLDKLSRELAKVRGGMKIQPATDDRPELEYSKIV